MKILNNVYMEELGADPAPGGSPAPVADPAPNDPPANYFGEAMPETWRGDLLSKAGFEPGDDYDKHLKQLDRVTDIGSLTKNYFEAQSKIRSGEISNGLPENPTDEQMGAYRLANGVPETAADYQLSLEEGLVLGDADEAIMSGIYDVAHANNVSTDTMSMMTNALLAGRVAQQEARTSQDGVDKLQTAQQLKEAWGGDHGTNINMVAGLVNQLPDSIKDPFMNARLPDGRAIFNSPEIMVAMAEWARKINPAATVVPNSANPVQTISDEIKALENRMGDSDWHKDVAANNRYMELIDARNAMG